MNTNETLACMVLAQSGRFMPAEMMRLYRTVGSASDILRLAEGKEVEHPVMLSAKLQEQLKSSQAFLRSAEDELNEVLKRGITPLIPTDECYPKRLHECADAPMVLYHRGTADLNNRRIVAVVGTRHVTTYGQDLVRNLLSGLKTHCPDIVVVSGLAYGVDICAHRHALEQGMETIGVLAHGHDDLYPSSHRDTANKMVLQGGLLTEYRLHTRAEKFNFVKRNRIVAGLADACIVIESAEKGGSLITARIARDYNREVFAFPGRTTDLHSQGCNHLIRDQVAAMITSADDFVQTMGWENDRQLLDAQQSGIERHLFPHLSEDEQRVVDILGKTNDLQINVLVVRSGIPAGRMSAILFELEMKGVLRTMAGGTCHLYPL